MPHLPGHEAGLSLPKERGADRRHLQAPHHGPSALISQPLVLPSVGSLVPLTLLSQLTCLSGDLHKSLNPALSIVALGGQCGYIVPSQCPHDVHHSLGLVGIRRHHTGEEVVACGVAELRGCGGIADLGNLEGERTPRL